MNPAQVSPFNIVDSIQNPFFILEEVKMLFVEFVSNQNISIEQEVVEDIFTQTEGEEENAHFLASQGVLQPHPHESSLFKLSSPLLRELIMSCVITVLYPNCPQSEVPFKGNKLNIIEVLKKFIAAFDKEMIEWAWICSYKNAYVLVNGCKNENVPRESVYDQELYQILNNWLNPFNIKITDGKRLERMMLSDDEWQLMNELTLILKSFEELTRMMSGNSYVTISLIYPSITTLKNNLDELLLKERTTNKLLIEEFEGNENTVIEGQDDVFGIVDITDEDVADNIVVSVSTKKN
nr:6469_t:CDS:2 [Entrophospora candida]